MNVLDLKYLKQMDKFIHYCNNYINPSLTVGKVKNG